MFYLPERGNRLPKRKRISDSEHVVLSVRDFVAQKRVYRERVTSVEVLKHLVECGSISVMKYSNGNVNLQDHSSSTRAVHRFLSRNGFKRGVKNGAVHVTPEHLRRATHTCEYYRRIVHLLWVSDCAKCIAMNLTVTITSA